MVSLMQKDTLVLRLTQTERKIDLRTQESHNKRDGNAVTFIDIIFVFYGGGNRLFQPSDGKRLISKEQQDTGNPDSNHDIGNGKNSLQRFC